MSTTPVVIEYLRGLRSHIKSDCVVFSLQVMTDFALRSHDFLQFGHSRVLLVLPSSKGGKTVTKGVIYRHQTITVMPQYVLSLPYQEQPLAQQHKCRNKYSIPRANFNFFRSFSKWRRPNALEAAHNIAKFSVSHARICLGALSQETMFKKLITELY